MATVLGETDYRQGALERLAESFHLLRQEHFAGSVYLAGRGVEGMLRALIWRHDSDVRTGRKSLDTGHHLRNLLDEVADLGVLGDDEHRDELANSVQRVARLWFNNMRFVPSKRLEQYWRGIGELGRRRSLKSVSHDFVNSCSAIIKRCEVLLCRG